MNQKSDTNWKNTLLSFLPINVIFSLKCACISSTILTFLPYIPVHFYNKNSQKVNYSSKCDYKTGHFIDFSYEKSDSSSICACIWSTILTFLANNPLCFYTKNSQKVHFSSNWLCLYSRAFIDFSSKIMWFFPQNAPAYRAIFNNPLYFYNKNSQKDNFYSNFDYNTGHFIDFSPKKNDYFLKMHLHIEHYFDFFAQ